MQPLARSWAANGAKRASAPEPPAPLRSLVSRKPAAHALLAEQFPASFTYTSRGPRLLFRLRREKEGRTRPARSLSPSPLDSLKFASLVGSSSLASGVSCASICQTGVRSALSQAVYCRAVLRFVRT